MAVDAHANFAYSTVATAPSPATSGTSLVVHSGDGALFPAAPFNAVVWPTGSSVAPISSAGEIVRVTNVSTDTLTITRTQESSTNRSIVVGDQIAASVTKKTLTDIEGVITPHFIGQGSAPAIAANAGAGSSPTISIVGSDSAGKITLTTGTAPSGTNATICTVTFATAFSAAPYVSFSPANANAAGLAAALTMIYANSGTTTFTMISGTTALGSATQYIWFYEVIG